MITLVGLAVPFDRVALIENCRVRFERGAFTRAIQAGELRLQINHVDSAVIASLNEGSLAVNQDDNGLYFAARVGDPDWAVILRGWSDLGRLTGVSPAWRVGSERGYWDGPVKVISACELLEFSIMTGRWRPTFSDTWVRVRASSLAA